MPIPFFCFKPIHPWCNPVEIEPRLSDPLFGHGEWKHIFHFHTLIQRSGDNLNQLSKLYESNKVSYSVMYKSFILLILNLNDAY